MQKKNNSTLNETKHERTWFVPTGLGALVRCDIREVTKENNHELLTGGALNAFCKSEAKTHVNHKDSFSRNSSNDTE